MLGVVLALTGCQAGSGNVVEETSAGVPGFVECIEPRPVDCPLGQRQPVCAELPRAPRDCMKAHCLPGMTTKTYSNACFACLDPTVTGYEPGRCSGEFSIF